MRVWVGVDVGKTLVRVGVFDEGLTLLTRWAQATPDVPAALAALEGELAEAGRRWDVAGVGLSIFGPLATERARKDYGSLPQSSDAAWNGVNVPWLVSSVLRSPVFFDYDVNAGALAEATLGAGKTAASFFYLSVGTGVGGALFRHGLQAGYAPQIGHMLLPLDAQDAAFAGSCPFHGRCLQGLASGRAMQERWGMAARMIAPEHPAWDLEAHYLSAACANLVYSFSPERIVLGSSVGVRPGLAGKVNARLTTMLNGFVEPELRSLYAEEPPVRPAMAGADSSLIGAALLARDALGLRFSPQGGR